jgi:hypothetical protein
MDCTAGKYRKDPSLYGDPDDIPVGSSCSGCGASSGSFQPLTKQSECIACKSGTYRRTKNAAGVPVAGTSAGASIMSEHMVAGGQGNNIPAAGAVTLAPGIGLTNAVIIDQHFTHSFLSAIG